MFPLAFTLAIAAPQEQNTFVQDAIVRKAANERAAFERKPVEMGGWNAGYQILFKGKVVGEAIAPNEDGVSMHALIVKTKGGGLATVELGPTNYVEAQAVKYHRNTSIWVAGSKTFNGTQWVVLAQRINVEGSRPSFRKADGSPLW